ncbi:MAG: thiol-disulfide oxidoreductase DCC family protein [Candidatus Sericytochromatia bacterium]|nr:thiol-disulfide oxidoreductase DCC family protein [Candidatus Sericytochromatia bacterium]
MSDRPHAIVLFDGICNLCNSSVQFMIDHDPDAHLRFASLQSEVGQTLLAQHHLPTQNFKSLILIEGDQIFARSTAALKIARYLQGYRWLSLFLWVPAFLRNGVYDLIARNRYQWFGKSESCRIPTPELKSRFLG